MADGEPLAAVRREIRESRLVGEGHKKITARLASARHPHQPQARAAADARRRAARAHPEGPSPRPPRPRRAHQHRHPGRDVGDRPDRGMDAPGRPRAVFALVDHATGEAWVDAAPKTDRWAAADPLREAVADRFGSVEAGVATGLKPRHDGGSCFPLGAPPGRTQTPRPRTPARVRLRARNQRRHRKVHPDPQKAGALDRTLRHPRAAARACASSPATSTSTGCSNATAIAPHAKPATPSITPPRHDRRDHQPGVR